MSFLAPTAFILAALLPIILALYFLRLRREEQTVSSVYLWQQAVRDVAANAPWQRLRANWLLLLQLLFLAILILALARPFSWARGAAGHLILIVDTSASMRATDVAADGSSPDRLAAAVGAARALVDDLPAESPVTLIAAGDQARMLLLSSRDRGQLHRALDTLEATTGGADLTTALELAAAAVGNAQASEIVVLSDGGVSPPDRSSTAVPVRYVPVGVSAENQAISAFSLTSGTAGQGLSAFVCVTNYGSREVERRLTLYDGANPIAARDISLPPDDTVALTLPDVASGVTAMEARLGGQDHLPLDDRAWAVAPAASAVRITIVGPGNRFLETALSLLPNAEITSISLAEYEAQLTNPPSTSLPSPNPLTIFDTVLPSSDRLPPGALFFIGPPRSSAFFSVTGSVESPIPRPASADEPLLRHVDLRDIAIQRTPHLQLPAWGRSVIVAASDDGSDNVPLLTVGQVDGRRLAVLAFDLRQSDLPLRVAFPLLLANLMDFLTPGTTGTLPETISPGRPMAIPLPPEAKGASVTRPDGTTTWVPAKGGQVVLVETGVLGIYEVKGKSGNQDRLLHRFAVNGFNPQESDIVPREHLDLPSSGTQTEAAERPTRREWWRPIAWIALAILTTEWLVQHRGAAGWAWSKTIDHVTRFLSRKRGVT
jgi:Ca-activated chloride channel family protein